MSKYVFLSLLIFLLIGCKKSTPTTQSNQNTSTSIQNPIQVDTNVFEYDVTFLINVAHPKTFNPNTNTFTDYKLTQDSIKVYTNTQLLTNITYKIDNTTSNSGVYQVDNQINTPILKMKTGDSLTITFAHLEYTGGTSLNQAQNFIKITQICMGNPDKNVYDGFKPMLVSHGSTGNDLYLGQDNGNQPYVGKDWYLGGPATFKFKIINK
ncbi:MAG: hypothetical protein JWO32_1313 [Bacteroidetes bacterium]|nr:hypothetical protein [Bacteroidota bacterium]